MPNRNPWKTLEQTEVYKNAWLRVREDKVLRPDGGQGIYGVVEIPASVGVVALNGGGEVALAGQWRYVNQRYSWEIPRGGSHAGETGMLAAAQRELAEECGIKAENWELLSAVDVCNGVTTDVQSLFLATGLCRTEQNQDPEEQIITRFVPLREAVDMVMRGEITEVCSVAALLMVANRLRPSSRP
jgi:8-oxo-dGTP pyrophosphatase MutT (NUDIX family)